MAASRWIAALALIFAATLHAAGLMRLDLLQDVEMAGGQAGAMEASLGDAFADMAEGTLSAVETTEVSETVPVEDRVEPSEADEMAEPQNTEEAPRPPAQTATQADQPEPQATVLSAQDAEPVPTPTLRVTPSPPTPEAIETPQATAQAPVTPPTPDVLTAQEPAQLDLTQSLRPNVRSRAFEERHKPDDPPPEPRRTARTEPAPAAQGNQAQTNARAGQTDGASATTNARRATGNQQSASVGNAAVSNYPGEVMRRLQRMRRPRINDTGTPVVVTFRIAANGALSAVSIAQSSGSASLDRAAVQMIQRAAPFPAPPPGATRSFNVPIRGG